MKHRSSIHALLSIAALTLAATAALADGPPSLNAPDLGQGPYSLMHMRLQKTLLKINVADIDVRVDKATQAKLAQTAAGQPYSEGLDYQLAPIIIGAPRAVVQMQFVRDIPLNRWIGVVRDNMEQAREAGLITREMEQRVSDGLPVWFASLKDRGYLKGDRLVYSISPDGLHTFVVAAGGQVMLERTDHGDGRRVVLASYFAPKSEMRQPLIRSLLSSK